MLAVTIGNKSIVIDQIAYITQQTDNNSTNYTLVLVDGTSLHSITVGATSWDTNCTTDWVRSVPVSGTFTKPSGTTIPTGTNGIPSGWAVVNV